jgi:alpha-beta hydrolase superfamily lysophospholipase
MNAPLQRNAGTPLWLADAASPVLGWLHQPTGPARACVLLCPPLGYESWTTYQTYRELAESLSAAGFLALRFDYAGTGDSAGHELEPERLQAWRNSIAIAVRELAVRCPDAEIILMGLRFGASLALEQAHALGINTLVLWDPVISGRRYVRELTMMARAGEAGAGEAEDGILEVAGCLYTRDTINAMAALDLTNVAWPSAGRQLLLLERDDRQSAAAFAEQTRQGGATVDVQSVAGTAAMMDVSTEDSRVPDNIVTTIVDWLSARFDGRVSHVTERAATDLALMDGDSVRISEQLLRVAPLGLFGILGRPANGTTHRAVMFLSSGTEHRIGPGRSWVTLSRSMNSRGVATLRVDLDGIGDSPLRGGKRRVRPYDRYFLDDVRDAVTHLRSLGFTHVTVLGLCSGAWVAVQAGLTLPVDAVVAINPQLYWDWGDPVESLLQETRARRAPLRQRELTGQRYGLWTALDMLGIRPTAGRWLDELVAKQVHTLLAFATDDDGLQYLQTRCERRLRKVMASHVVNMTEVAGLDHPMHRHRRRPEIFAAITDFVASR